MFPALGSPEEIYNREGSEILRERERSALRVMAPRRIAESAEPLSLLEFIASKGGLKPNPELSVLGLDDIKVLCVPKTLSELMTRWKRLG